MTDKQALEKALDEAEKQYKQISDDYQKCSLQLDNLQQSLRAYKQRCDGLKLALSVLG